MRAREKLYLYALGLLNLDHEELWWITNGQLADLIVAHEYRLFRQRQEQAIHTVALFNLWSEKKISIQDLTGVWYKNQVWDKRELLDKFLDREEAI